MSSGAMSRRFSEAVLAASVLLAMPFRAHTLLAQSPASAESSKAEAGAKIESVIPERAGLGDRITVKVQRFLKGKHAQNEWILFLDGVALKGIHPENSDFENGEIKFALRRTEPSAEAWQTLLRGWVFSRPIHVALGTEKAIETSIAELPEGFELVVVPRDWRLITSALLAVCAVGAIIALGVRSSLLRDAPVDTGKGPYSLGKVQWAWWLVLILYAYLAIGLVTWDYYNIFSVTALALLGISTATALGSVVIDSARTTASTSPSTNFIRDIISDAQGVSLHRFQALVWTIVLGFVFIIGVWNNKTMPDFSPTLLALMGISGGTYLAFKIPEAPK